MLEMTHHDEKRRADALHVPRRDVGNQGGGTASSDIARRPLSDSNTTYYY
jgi:hypothetical protein